MMDYAIALEGESGWIKLTQRISSQPPREGQILSGIIESKETKNGEPYKKFTKQNADYQKPAQPTTGPQMDYIVQMLEELTGRREVADTVTSAKPVDDDPFGGLV